MPGSSKKNEQSTLLRNVLVDYLDATHERDFDFPFLALLPQLGFRDVHYTHGQAEFGKDFIAKKGENGASTQYSFQLKAGDIGQAEWREAVMGQMLESVLSGLSHPCFDRQLPHLAVLVTTGRLKGNAALGLQDLNTKIKDQYKLLPIQLWDREKLANDLEEYGLGNVYHATAADFFSVGAFYTLYGKSLQGSVSERDIEHHSRYWLDYPLAIGAKLLRAAIEAEVIATQCVCQGYLYEGLHAHLAAVRLILYELHRVRSPAESEQLTALYELALQRTRSAARVFYSEVRKRWKGAGQNLATIIDGPAPMFTYPVHCARILEVCAFLYLLEADKVAREQIVSFIADFALSEPGCAHIPSDRYAISLVLPVVVLCAISRRHSARQLVRRTAIWLCDRYEKGWGIASVGADADDEIATLLGDPFECVTERKRKGSFLACVIADLSAFVGDQDFYGDVVNDIKATGISPEYWQAPDTDGLYRIEGRDVITYPYVGYADSLSDFQSFEFAEHVEHEPSTFSIVQLVGPSSLMALMLLLRDRYFPTAWLALAQVCQ